MRRNRMIDTVTVIIEGEPVAQGRPRFTKGGHAYDPARSREYKDIVAAHAKLAMNEREIFSRETPLACVMSIFVKMPKRFTRTQRQEAEKKGLRPVRKPDIDNIAKILMDALNGIVYEDDAQIVSLGCRKYYSDAPMAAVTVSPIE